MAIKYLDAKRIRGSSTGTKASAEFEETFSGAGHTSDGTTVNGWTANDISVLRYEGLSGTGLTGVANFDGDDKVTLGGSASDYNFLTTAFSIAFWLKPDALSNNNTIFDNTNGSASANGLVLRFEDSEMKIRLMQGKSGGQNVSVLSDGDEMVVNEWQHLAFTYDGTTGKIYRNGLVIKSTAMTSHTGTANAVPAIGDCISGGDSGYDGAIQDFVITNDALTAAEVLSLASGSVASVLGSSGNNQKIHYPLTANFNDAVSSGGLGNGTASGNAAINTTTKGKQGDNLHFNITNSGGVEDTAYYDLQQAGGLGANANATDWTLRFKINVVTKAGSTQNGTQFTMGLASHTGNVSRDFMGIFILQSHSSSGNRVVNGTVNGNYPQNQGTSSNYLGGSSQTIELTSGTDWWVDITRDGDDCACTIYTDEFTGTSYTLTKTVASIADLRYLIFGNYSGEATFVGSVDDIKFYNGGMTQDEKATLVTTIAASSPDFDEDYGTPTYTWTQTGSNITVTGGFAYMNNGGSTDGHRITAPLGVTLSDSTWLADFDYKAGASTRNLYPFLLTAGTSIARTSNQDMIGVRESNASPRYGLTIISKDGSGSLSGTSEGDSVATSTQDTWYYCRLKRTASGGSDNVTLQAWSTDALRTAGGTPDVGTETATVASTVGGLTTIQHAGDAGGGASSGRTYWIDNTKIYNSISTVVSASSSTNLPENTLFDETDTYKIWWLQNNAWAGYITRGVFGGSLNTSTKGDIEYITIATTGNATDFGDLTSGRDAGAGVADSTRGCFCGGKDTSDVHTDIIDYITVATIGNATDFGNLSVARRMTAGVDNDSRGVIVGGYDGSAYSNVIDYFAIATLGNATDFGDSTVSKDGRHGLDDNSRGVIGGGGSPSTNVMDYVTIATTGNSTDFGDLNNAVGGSVGVSNNTRGCFCGGQRSVQDDHIDVIDYITIATTGNATDFGNLLAVLGNSGSCDNKSRGVIAGGQGQQNVIQYITIDTTGNSTDFGDLTAGKYGMGGLSA